MSAISEFAAKMATHQTKIDTAISGLQGDLATLNATIAQLQSTQGQVTPEDQALIDQIESQAKSVSDQLDALDAITPPAPPPVP